MISTIVRNIEQVTPAWLTEKLRSTEALHHGAVNTVSIEQNERNLSTNFRLKLTYTDDARGQLPPNLFLKLVQTDQDDESFGESEVNYYTRDYIGVENTPIPRTYDASYSKELGCYHILMDDFSTTHRMADNLPPSLEYGLMLSEGLAALHAPWWDVERLGQIHETMPNAEEITEFTNMGRNGADHIIAGAADQLKPHWPELILDIYAKHPQKTIERTQNPAGFTLIHGDPNAKNILVPKNGQRPLYIIDRQPFNWSLTVWLGVYDVVYATILEWEPAFRRQHEHAVLKEYHNHLMDNGATGYSWEHLYEDYRFCIAMGVYIATEYCRSNFSERTYQTWMLMLQRTLTAFDDLSCAELL